MTRLDRYLLSQFMAIFGFFALVLVSIYWVNQAVRLFDQLISDGQTALVVLEFTALTLPYVIRVVLPIAAFAATVYAINRLSSESELVAMQAAGTSPWRLARPVVMFGVIVALLMLVLTNFLVPKARERLAIRQEQVAENITASLLTPGRFQHPSDDISVYIRQISDRGEFLDFYLWDSRNPENRMSYLAKKAVIIRSDTGPKLIMFDGSVQSLRTQDGRLSLTKFSNLTYDLGNLTKNVSSLTRSLDSIPTPELLGDPQSIMAETETTQGAIWLEVLGRQTQPLLAPVAALIGFAALMVGSFSRFGVWRQIALSVVLLVFIQVLSNVTEGIAASNGARWPVLFAPSGIGTVIAIVLIWWSTRPRRVRKLKPAGGLT
ncbi:LPS export ABC transporter permease LptF [Rhodobacteraceae bacterium]|nr:LPS export ABC transporter permease LptF [Paracoccaceae bacterium]